MIKIGTRGSKLALWQANHVQSLLCQETTKIIEIKTQGDKIQNVSFEKMEGKAFFTKEIEDALLGRHVDIAVHSLKDLPTEKTEGLKIAAILQREDPSDILVIRKESCTPENFLMLGDNAVIGTSSLRRAAQIRNARPSLVIEPLRGNVPTRIAKLRDGKFDAIILASAGIKRLDINIDDFETLPLPFSFFLPCPSQGAVAVQIRENEKELETKISALNDEKTLREVEAERSFLKHFGGGCHIPLGAYAYIHQNEIHLTGSITSVDGSKTLRHSVKGNDPEKIGGELASVLKQKGADKLI